MRREYDLFDPSNEDLFEFFDINKDHYISMDEFSQRLKSPKGLHETWFFCNGLTFSHLLSSLATSFLSVQWSINAHRNLFLLSSEDQPCTIEQRNSSSIRRCRPGHDHLSFFLIFVEMLVYCFSLFIKNIIVSPLSPLEKKTWIEHGPIPQLVSANSLRAENFSSSLSEFFSIKFKLLSCAPHFPVKLSEKRL